MFKKKKIVLTSVLALAGVSLATVGFATWVVGLQKTEESLHVKAIVDSSMNKSVYLEAETSKEEVIVAESVTYETAGKNEIVTTAAGTGVTVSDKALQFSFTKLQFSIGNDINETMVGYPVSMTIELLKTDACNKVNFADCLMDTNYRDAATNTEGKSQYYYLQFSHTFDLVISGENPNVECIKGEETGSKLSYKTYQVKDRTYTLQWGNYFGNDEAHNDSPLNFYNKKAVAKATKIEAEKGDVKSALFTDAENANQEFKAMKAALEGSGSELTVKVSLGLKK